MHAEPLGQSESEAIEQSGLCAIGADDASQPQFALWRGRRWQDHVGAVDGAEFLKDGARRITQTGAALPLFEGLPQNIGEETDENVRQNTRLSLMSNWADRQLTLVDAEGGLGFGKLDVGLPQRLGRPVADVRTQHVTAFAMA